jgi:hypothetical protein
MKGRETNLAPIRRFRAGGGASTASARCGGRALRVGARARGETGTYWEVAVFLAGRAWSRDTLKLADAADDLIVDGRDTYPISLSEDGETASPIPLDRIEAEGIRLWRALTTRILKRPRSCCVSLRPQIPK